MRRGENGLEFRVHWSGEWQGEEHATWEPEVNVSGCEAYENYMKQLKADQEDESSDEDDVPLSKKMKKK